MNLMSVFAELSLDSTKYEQGLKSAKTQAGKFEKEQESLEKAVEGTTKDLNTQKTSTNKLETAMSSASKVAGTFGSAISGMSKVITGVVGGATALIGALAGVSAGTVETRQEMNQLNASFQANGKTVEEAEEVYKSFYGILGESDTAVEASNLLIQLTDDNKELAKWADISAGVMATFPDSLPIESLIEASNETAKVGEVTGSLADALNWAGINEEQFNLQLQSLATEEERVSLITETLNAQYKEAGDIFKENNASIISYRDAQVNLTNALNDLGEAFQPILTMFTQMASEILPKVTSMVEQLVDAFDTGGIEGFSKELSTLVSKGLVDLTKQLPKFIKFGVDLLKNIIKGLKQYSDEIGNAIIDIISLLINSIIEMLPEVIILGAELLKSLMQGIAENIELLMETWVNMITQLVDYVIENIDIFINLATQIIFALIDGLIANLDKLVIAGIDLTVAITTGLIKALPQLLAKIPEIITNLALALTTPEMLAKIIEAGVILILALVGGIVGSIPQLIMIVPDLIFNFFSELSRVILDTDWPQLGKDIVLGIVEGLGSVGGSIWEGIKNVGTSILEGFKDFFNIHSPSKLMEDKIGYHLGTGTVKGIPEGVESELANTEKTIGNMITSMDIGSPQLDLSTDYTAGTTMQNQMIENTIVLDGQKIATSTNKANYKNEIRTMFA